MLRSTLLRLALFASLSVACVPQDAAAGLEGGANANDRTKGGAQGETLLTGAMTVSPRGDYVFAQRNAVSVIYDLGKKTFTELDFQPTRFVFSPKAAFGYALATDGSVVGLDLATGKKAWQSTPMAKVSLLRVSADDRSIVQGDDHQIRVLDAASGAVRVSEELGGVASFAAFLPTANKVLVASDTRFTDHKPETKVLVADLSGLTPVARLAVPNCTAPIEVLPDETRAFLSPTFCAEDVPANTTQTWTNPDPVSVIDLGAAPTFVKNLPGFGPVAMPADGGRVVAYLDMQRIDASMFADPKQIPSKDGPQYHLMVIDPKSLAFSLTPIGNALPRFALSRDGKGLLVDASIKVKTRVKAKAAATLTIGPSGISGQVSAEATVFQEKSPFGWFDLSTRAFTAFSGPMAGLDRFVQPSEGPVVTLMRRTDGLGGDAFTIDLDVKSTQAIAVGVANSGLRDVGLLPDGKTVAFRLRLTASNKSSKLYSREALCLSLDLGKTCAAGYIEYEAKVPFADADPEGSCPGGHDCW
ncbi:MAG: hypothetical protein IPJ34_21360 [Myxococcales bacterium]|nr:hypothetical protein [Myxococcales bacterium]